MARPSMLLRTATSRRVGGSALVITSFVWNAQYCAREAFIWKFSSATRNTTWKITGIARIVSHLLSMPGFSILPIGAGCDHVPREMPEEKSLRQPQISRMNADEES